MKRFIGLVLLGLVAAGCGRGGPATADAPVATPPPVAVPQAPAVALEDVVETTSAYMVGISYPKSVAKYPGLAAELKRYAEAARGELMTAVKGRPAEGNTAPYELSLSFTEVLESPGLVAVAAEGSRYTGGAHGQPLLERFVWLPAQDKRLTATDLVPDPDGWKAISAHVREQLHTALSQRVDADQLALAERAEVVKNAGRMIDEGTQPDAKNFGQFEPVIAPGGKLSALRFVFPPYQVGPYSDGVQTVEVPASVLLPHIAPAYRSLFAQD